MSTTISSLVGLPQDNRAARVIRYSHQQYDLLFVIGFCGENALEKTKEIEQHILSALPFSAEALYTLCSDLTEQYGSQGALQYSGILKNRDHVVSVGYNGIVSLIRNKKVGFLIANTNTIALVEGKWKAEDTYIVATQSANTIFDELYARLQQGYDAKNILNELSEPFHNNPKSGCDVITLATPTEILDVTLPIEVGTSNKSYNEKVEEVEENPIVLHTHSQRKGLKIFVGPAVHIRNWFVFLKHSKIAKILLIISCIIIVGVTVFIVFFLKNRTAKITALETQLLPLRQEVETIENNKNANAFDRKNKIEEIIKKLQSLKNETENTAFLQSKIDYDIEKASAVYAATNQVGAIDSVAVFFDASEVKSDFIGTQIEKIDNTIALLDTGTQQLLFIDATSKQHTLLSLDGKNSKGLGTNSEKLYIIGNGVFDTNPTNQVINELIKSNDEIINSELVSGFENNIYVLNKTKRNIYRYAVNGSGISEPLPWVKATKGLDFDTVSDMAIDGKVWLGTNDGKIIAFLQGSETEFSVPNVSPPIQTSIKLFVSVGDTNIYILEPENKRVIILSKTGEFIAEIKNETFGSAIDLIAFEQNRMIYVLNGSLIQEIPY